MLLLTFGCWVGCHASDLNDSESDSDTEILSGKTKKDPWNEFFLPL